MNTSPFLPPTRSTRPVRSVLVGVSAVLTAVLLSGCGGASAPDTSSAPSGGTSSATGASAASSSASPSSQSSPAAEAPTVTDPWVKATEEGMTGVFLTLENTSDSPLHLVGATTEAAEHAELHETVQDGTGSTVMQAKEGGFVIEPGQSLELKPGADHIMLMGVRRPIEPGEQITVELEFADASTLTVEAVAKEYAGANEVYESGEESAHHDGH